MIGLTLLISLVSPASLHEYSTLNEINDLLCITFQNDRPYTLSVSQEDILLTCKSFRNKGSTIAGCSLQLQPKGNPWLFLASAATASTFLLTLTAASKFIFTVVAGGGSPILRNRSKPDLIFPSISDNCIKLFMGEDGLLNHF